MRKAGEAESNVIEQVCFKVSALKIYSNKPVLMFVKLLPRTQLCELKCSSAVKHSVNHSLPAGSSSLQMC